MASSRPIYIDLTDSRPFDNSENPDPLSRDIPSPRSGEVPPALSPLDEFAFQGRILAQQFQQSSNDGRRISRLPPLTIDHELARPRQNYFSPSTLTLSEEHCDSRNSRAPQEPAAKGEGTQSEWRPKSYYPFIQTFDDTSSILSGKSIISSAITNEYQQIPSIASEDKPLRDYDHQLEQTRSSLPDLVKGNDRQRRSEFSNKFGLSSTRQHQIQKKSLGFDLINSGGPVAVTPRSPGPHSLRNQPSIRSVRVDSGDDSNSNSFLSEPQDRERKLLNSSHLTRPRSPFSLPYGPPRSPSAVSEVSDSRQNAPRGSINFSRPISRTGRTSSEMTRPSLDIMRQTSMDSPKSRPSIDVLSLSDLMTSPVLNSTPSEEGFAIKYANHEPNANIDRSNPAPSYIYAKYSLPRGRILPPDFTISAKQSDQTHKFEWDQPFEGTNVTRLRIGETNPVDSRSSTKQNSQKLGTLKSTLTTQDLTIGGSSPTPPVRTRSADDSSPTGRSVRVHKPSPSFPPPTMNSQPTPATTNLRPSTSHSTRSQIPGIGAGVSVADDSSPEDHLTKGITCHEQGELQKSTYHLRIAARRGSATAMLLYALACRHGWGMRRNQAEGVEWLRKAVDSAGLEVASDEANLALERTSVITTSDEDATTLTQNPPLSNATERKSHKAQLALSIYELGVSYINGWGIAEDKALGLRCFEIAGAWGDADALAEAGFCYVKGVGCKKDLYKAADFYRRAEAGGISMAGNSWIYKEKYMPKQSLDERRSRADEETRNKDKGKQMRDKSRTRTIFGARKKSVLE